MTTATMSIDSEATAQDIRLTSIEITNPVTFARDLAILKDIVPRKTPKPILKSIILQADDDGHITALATNLECTIRLQIKGACAQVPGMICVDLAWLTEACKVPKNSTVWLEKTADGIQISSGGSWRTHPTDKPEDFPVIPGMPCNAPSFAVGINTLDRMFERTNHATDLQSNRYALGGVMLERGVSADQNNKVSFSAVATDGHRLEKETALIDEPEQGIPVSALIPALAMKVFHRFAKDTGNVLVAFLDKRAFFAIGERAVISTYIIDGRFPRYQDVFPDSHDTSVDIYTEETRAELVRVLTEMVRLRGNSESRGVTLEIKGPSVEIRYTRSEDSANNMASLTLPFRDGLSVKASIDPGFLRESIASHQATLRIEFGAGHAPIVIRSDSHQTVIMPMRVDRPDWNPGNPNCTDCIVIEGINDRPNVRRHAS